MSATDVLVAINGVDVTSQVRWQTCHIRPILNAAPDTASIDLAYRPSIGQDIKIGLGSLVTANLLFGGTIQEIGESYQNRARNRIWPVHCVDYSFLLNRRRPFGTWTATSATTIAQSLVTNYATGFTSTGVAGSLAAVSILFDGSDDFLTCLTRLATLIGGYCYVDYAKDVHLFLTEVTAAPSPVNTAHPPLNAPPITWTTDLSQVRTRVYVKGMGVSVTSVVPVGSTFVPVDNTTPFASGSGSAIVGSQVLTYTSTVLSVAIAAPVVSWVSVVLQADGGANNLVIGASYIFALAYTTLAGETVISNASPSAGPCDATHRSIQVTWTAVTFPSSATGLKLFASTNSGTSWFRIDGGGITLTATTFLAVISFVTPPVTVSTAGNEVPTGSTTTSSVGLTATTIPVANTAAFSSGGGIVAYTVNGVTYAATYTAKSALSGAGSLTGVPASGPGSIVVAIPSGASVTNVPGLKGIPTSGTGSIATPLNHGDTINLWAQRDDTAAQTALAAYEGGDGIHEYLLADPALVTAAMCTARGDADLAMFSHAIVSVTYATKDPLTRPGKTVSIAVGDGAWGVNGNYTIQEVQISVDVPNLATLGATLPDRYPRFTVKAASAAFTLADLLRRVPLVP